MMLTLALLTFVTLSILLAPVAAIPKYLKDGIYDSLSSHFHCPKFLHIDGATGCETTFEGASGAIRLIESDEQFDALTNNPPSDPITIFTTHDFLTTADINRLRDRHGLHVHGVMIEWSGAPQSHSPAIRALQSLPLSPNAADLPRPLALFQLSSQFNRSYEWNVYGDSMKMEYYPFDIQLLTSNDSPTVRQRAQDNEDLINEGNDPRWFAEFRNPSKASDNSRQCLADRTCQPVGSMSVWSTMRALNVSDEFVMVTASLDSQSVFTGSSTGAEADQSGVIAVLGAAQALSRLNSSLLLNLTKNILFFFPHGESFSHIGSRKFADDLLHFWCDDVNAYNSTYCDTPLKFDLRFMDLSHNASGHRVGLSKISSVIELQQVGLNSSYYVHAEHDSNSDRERLIDRVMALAVNVSGVTIDRASNNTPGIPPSASETFLSVNSSLPVIVISDYSEVFSNRYYHSHFDRGDNNLYHTDDTSIQSPNICALATLLARTLYTEAGGNASAATALECDCHYVTQLIKCFAIDVACDELKRYSGPLSDGSDNKNNDYPSHSTGPFYTLDFNTDFYFSGSGYQQLLSAAIYPNYIFDQMRGWFRNVSGEAHYHEAVDPALVFDVDDGVWQMVRANDTRYWTQANGIIRFSRMFAVESPRVELTMMALGIVLLAVSVIAAIVGSRLAKTKFKAA